MKKWEEMTNREKMLYVMCTNHTGKMEGMVSISTSTLLNENCQKMRKVKGSICESCYAYAMASYRKSMALKLQRATELLTEEVIAYDDIPYLNTQLFRYEAFGDLRNTIQGYNYFNIAEKNGHTNTALWTKHPQVIAKTMVEYGVCKPENMCINLSAPMIDHPLDYEEVVKVFPFVDKVFNVWRKETAERLGININCGGRKCATCQLCYHKDNGVHVINELLK